MLARTTSKDLGLSLAATVAGGAALIAGLRMHWNPGDLSPGIEGAITTTVTGFVMLLLHGVDYPRNLLINVPMLVMLYVACAATTTPGIGAGMVGVQLVIMGLSGVALARREPPRVYSAGCAVFSSPRWASRDSLSPLAPAAAASTPRS